MHSLYQNCNSLCQLGYLTFLGIFAPLNYFHHLRPHLLQLVRFRQLFEMHEIVSVSTLHVARHRPLDILECVSQSAVVAAADLHHLLVDPLHKFVEDAGAGQSFVVAELAEHIEVGLYLDFFGQLQHIQQLCYQAIARQLADLLFQLSHDCMQ